MKINMKSNICFICETSDERSKLRQIETMQTYENLKRFACTLNDTKLLGSLSGPDAIAQEMKYHLNCYTTLQNKVRSLQNTKNGENDQSQINSSCYPVAFSELLAYIYESNASSEEEPTVFRLADLVKMYSNRLFELGIETPVINSTRLKELILLHMPEVEAYNCRRDVMIAFKKMLVIYYQR